MNSSLKTHTQIYTVLHWKEKRIKISSLSLPVLFILHCIRPFLW